MSLFNRPAWAKSQAANIDQDESEANLFSHSARSYSDIVAEQERKKRAKTEKNKAREERRSLGKREINEEGDGGSPKKRRITLEDGEALLSSVGLVPAPSPDIFAEDEDSAAGEVKRLPVRRSPRINRHVNKEDPRIARKYSKSTRVVGLGGSDDEEVFIVNTAPPPSEDPAEEESDDEFAELARRARMHRLQKERLEKKSQTPDLIAFSPSPGVGTGDTGQSSLPTPPPDPTIQIFITSRLPNANPLIVHRKLSQRIQEIRQVWCTKQGFSEEYAKDVFFVHRMRRVYDVTTCRSLGLELDSFGNVIMRGAEGKEGVDKVHLEAVTNELFEQLKAEKAREAKRRSGDLPEEPAEAGAADDREEVPQAKEESLIRLLLKAKGKEDFKLKVKPSTPFSKIIAAYSKTQVEGGRSVFLEFDGDRLNPDHEVRNTEVSDMDCIDVYIN